MDKLYCFELTENGVKKTEISNYEQRCISRYQDIFTLKYRDSSTGLCREVRIANLDRFKNKRVYSWNSDKNHAASIMLNDIKKKKQAALELINRLDKSLLLLDKELNNEARE